MKKLVLSLIAVFVLSGVSFAHTTIDINDVVLEDDGDKVDIRAEVDAPKLIRLTENLFLGGEAGKDLNGTNSEDGWYAVGKITYTGTWFSFKK